MSGRGRGIDNAPAWMSRGDRGSDPLGGSSQDEFGRGMRGGGGPPPRGIPPLQRYDDRGPPPPRYDERYDRRPRYDHHPHGPPPRGPGPGPGPGGGYGHGYGPPPPRRGSGSGSGGGGGGGPPPSRRPRNGNGIISFRSFEEEREWVLDRRRKRIARPSKFDKPPTPQQLATDANLKALSNPAATDFAGIQPGRNFADVPQQTRHARRLYIGNLPPHVTEEELHIFFRTAIKQAIVEETLQDDPILSVYINHERRFCFLEFKTVEMATACLELDGINISGKGKVKVKRPNDYNPTMAPKVHPSSLPVLDVSRLGIISGTVQDGPNKVFIGGLHYHLTEDQVLELLQAFGKVKAFHLVKNEPDSSTSKGYCFVEYADANVTPVAVMGLNGMDLGGGRMLTARVAAERTGAVTSTVAAPTVASTTGLAPGPPGASTLRPEAIIIDGYDVEILVDAAMGLRPMPTAPMHVDQYGMPITRPVPVTAGAALPPITATSPAANSALPPGASALDIANAALAAAMGKSSGSASTTPNLPPTRILVLLNMVTEEDLATDEEYKGLEEEVREECAKFGKLLGMKIPRKITDSIAPSAIKKIFLEYATAQDASTAERELAGRQFGPNVVQASYYSEDEYQKGVLR